MIELDFSLNKTQSQYIVLNHFHLILCKGQQLSTLLCLRLSAHDIKEDGGVKRMCDNR